MLHEYRLGSCSSVDRGYEGIFQQKILVCHVFVSLCDICKFWTLVCESCDIFGGYSQLEHLKG